jgi:IS30 family transposase
VGVSRSAANNGAPGCKTYRRGQVVGFVPALDRLAVRQISPRYLSQNERIDIADLRRAGLSIRQIAAKIGRAPSTVSRELRRNGAYRPFEAQRWTVTRRARRHRRRIETNPELCQVIAELLAQRWSPPPIARHLRREFPRPALDVVVPRKYLPGRLLARLTAHTTL